MTMRNVRLAAAALALSFSACHDDGAPEEKKTDKESSQIVEKCPSTLLVCDEACVDPQTDPTHCGSCETTCGEGNFCSAGKCVSSCDAGRLACAGSCVDAQTNVQHCGACGTTCAQGERCITGQCGACSSEQTLSGELPQAVKLDTRGKGNLFNGSCGKGASSESSVSFTAPHTGPFEFSTEGSKINTVLYVLDGACGGSELACNDDFEEGVLASWLVVNLAEGQTVTVVADGYDGQEGEVSLRVSDGSSMQCCEFSDEPGCAARSVEQCVCEADSFCCTAAWDDLCVQVMIESGCGACVRTDVCEPIDLGKELTIARHHVPNASLDAVRASCGGLGRSEALFKYTAPAHGTYTFDTGGTAFDTVLAVVKDSCAGEQLACNDDAPTGSQSQVTLVLEPNEVVLIAVENFAGDVADLTLNVSGVSVPELDPACPLYPVPATNLPRVLTGNTSYGEEAVALSCMSFGGWQMLYRFVAPQPGTYFFDTSGSSIDTAVALFEGGCAGDEIACNDDDDTGTDGHSRLTVALTANQEVTVVVDSWEQGPFVLAYGTEGDEPVLVESTSCCVEHTGGGCKDATIEACVCGIDARCCDDINGWDYICLSTAKTECNLACD